MQPGRSHICDDQPLAGPISGSLGLSPGAAGLLVMVTQFGYGLGCLFIASLSGLYMAALFAGGALPVKV